MAEAVGRCLASRRETAGPGSPSIATSNVVAAAYEQTYLSVAQRPARTLARV